MQNMLGGESIIEALLQEQRELDEEIDSSDYEYNYDYDGMTTANPLTQGFAYSGTSAHGYAETSSQLYPSDSCIQLIGMCPTDQICIQVPNCI